MVPASQCIYNDDPFLVDVLGNINNLLWILFIICIGSQDNYSIASSFLDPSTCGIQAPFILLLLIDF